MSASESETARACSMADASSPRLRDAPFRSPWCAIPLLPVAWRSLSGQAGV
jgi:hypothetical protein